jgi:hypothetical protein
LYRNYLLLKSYVESFHKDVTEVGRINLKTQMILLI